MTKIWEKTAKGEPLWPATNKTGIWVHVGYRLPGTGAARGWEEILHVQSQKWWLCFAGAALKRYPTSKVKCGGCASLDWPWGDIPRPRAKQKPQQDGRRGKFMFRIKPHSRQRCSEGLCTPGPRNPTEPEAELSLLPVEVWISRGLPQGQGFWVQQTWVWHKPSWRRLPLTLP